MTAAINSLLHHTTFDKEEQILLKANNLKQLISRAASYKTVIRRLQEKRNFLFRLFPNQRERNMLAQLDKISSLKDESELRVQLVDFITLNQAYFWSARTAKL
jgi:hypothetical protein